MSETNKIGVALVVGFFLGLLTTTLMAVPALLRSQDETLELQRQLRVKADAIALCQAEKKEITGSYTVLFDGATAPSSADRAAEFVGEVAGVKWFHGTGKHEGARWFIPAKVEPIVYGAPQGTAFVWVDKKTKQVTGPLTPQVQP